MCHFQAGVRPSASFSLAGGEANGHLSSSKARAMCKFSNANERAAVPLSDGLPCYLSAPGVPHLYILKLSCYVADLNCCLCGCVNGGGR